MSEDNRLFHDNNVSLPKPPIVEQQSSLDEYCLGLMNDDMIPLGAKRPLEESFNNGKWPTTSCNTKEMGDKDSYECNPDFLMQTDLIAPILTPQQSGQESDIRNTVQAFAHNNSYAESSPYMAHQEQSPLRNCYSNFPTNQFPPAKIVSSSTHTDQNKVQINMATSFRGDVKMPPDLLDDGNGKELSSVDQSSTVGDLNATCLGKNFTPGHWDVVCGRGKNWLEYISNRRFRVLVANHLFDYFETISRKKKSQVIGSIVSAIQTCGSFVRKGPDGTWYRLSTKEAREKVSHCLRDCLIDPQNEQVKWSVEVRKERLRESQNAVFRSLEMMP